MVEYELSGAGDAIQERHYGGDAQGGIPIGDLCTMTLPAVPEYRLTHTYANGVLATSEYTGTGFKILVWNIEEIEGIRATADFTDSDFLLIYSVQSFFNLDDERNAVCGSGVQSCPF